MMRYFLLGILAVALIVLFSLSCYAGLTTLRTPPGETTETGGFSISRPVYLDTPVGRSYPAQVVIGQDVITYTFVVKRK